MSQSLLVKDQGSVLCIEINRPDVRNAFNEQLIQEISTVFETKVHQNPSAFRAVLFSGAGKVFSAGGDLNWMKKSVDLSLEENQKDTLALTKMFQLIHTCPIPVIGLIQGAAFGGGLGIVSVCDYAIASKEALFSFSEVKIGLAPAVISPFVVPRIGKSHAMALFTTGLRFDAARALNIGMIHEVVDRPEDLKGAGDTVLKNILASGPKAVQKAKQVVLNYGESTQVESMAKELAKLRTSEEGQEGVRSFLEKRKPNWLEER